MSDHEHHGNNFFSGLVLGGIIGAGLIWFLTQTEEGKKIKERIKEKSEDALDNLADLIEEMEEKGGEFKRKVRAVQEELNQKAKDIRGEIAQEAKEELSKIQELQDRGRKVAQKFFTKGGKPLG
jgi:gas vesicle protein